MKKFDFGDFLVALAIGIGVILVCFLLLILMSIVYIVFGVFGSVFLLSIGVASGAMAYISLRGFK